VSQRERGPQALEGGPTEEFAVERASATPKLRLVRRRRPAAMRSRAVSRATSELPLAELQRRFHRIVTHSGTLPEALRARRVDAESLFTAAPNLGVGDRLGVYHYAYHARLIDCLIDDYPAVQHALGERAFERLCREVIARRPSRGPNLNFYGGALLDQVRMRTTRIPQRRFVAELAELEWALTEAFHAPAPPALELDELRKLPLERWARLSFRQSPTVRVMTFSYPVNEYFQAVRDERDPKLPRPLWSATAVYRQGYRLRRMDLTRTTARLLERLFAGVPLGKALEEVARRHRDADIARRVMAWFTEWVAGGFFVLPARGAQGAGARRRRSS
jgi:hypothetical protein